MKTKWYERAWLMWLFLFIFPPVGILLVWIGHKEMSVKKKAILSAISLIWFIVALAIGGGKPKEETPAPQDPVITVTPTIAPMTEPTAEPTEEAPPALSTTIDDATKESIKAFVEAYIDEAYKTGTYYVCDILTPTQGNGGIVSLQIEDASFTDEDICKNTVKEIVSEMVGNEGYKDINSFQFSMLAGSTVTYIIDVTDAQTLTVENINDHMSSTAM